MGKIRGTLLRIGKQSIKQDANFAGGSSRLKAGLGRCYMYFSRKAERARNEHVVVVLPFDVSFLSTHRSQSPNTSARVRTLRASTRSVMVMKEYPRSVRIFFKYSKVANDQRARCEHLE